MSSVAATRSPASRTPRPARRGGRVLERYRDADGAIRELTVRIGAQGSMLLVDRNPARPGTEHLVAHLAADEPRENAALAARIYLDADPESRRCRKLEDRDVERPPFAPVAKPSPQSGACPPVTAAVGYFRLRPVPAGMSIPALRWTRDGAGTSRAPAVLSLRDAIGEVESYEPFCDLTQAALARYEDDPSISSTVLRAEISRVIDSPIVLNRGLREAVVATVARGQTTMSEIALRCGRMKRDAKGHTSGETSWLARRVGLLPEGGLDRPTRWVHTDVLALIARQGLGIAPREVELG